MVSILQMLTKDIDMAEKNGVARGLKFHCFVEGEYQWLLRLIKEV